MDDATFVSGMVALGSSLGGSLSTIVLSAFKDRRTRPIIKDALAEHLAPVLARLAKAEGALETLRDQRRVDLDRFQSLREQYELWRMELERTGQLPPCMQKEPCPKEPR